ncbi:agarase [Algisphaera agarilytica]|uniref:Agarase n=1 Tax=Algisphaera agarilytica TaxID=1385975 RepID=A0A7X0LJ40_9BACT|nr:agarase [Algisphaera agarilytica]
MISFQSPKLSAACSLMVLSPVLVSCAQQSTVVVEVDPTVRHHIGDVTGFERSKYINMHSSPTEGEWDSPEMMDQFLNGWDVYLGREAGQPRLYVDQTPEDPDKPGYPSVEHIEQFGLELREAYEENTAIHQYEDRTELIVAMHPHPFFPDGTPTDMGWAFANMEASATFTGHYFKHFYQQSEDQPGPPMPEYFEVLNEPLWDLVDSAHAKEDVTREDIFRFHNVVADKVRELNPGTDMKIGGFCQASADPEEDNFEEWDRTWGSFMEIAGDNMDFFAVHFYDKGWDRGLQYRTKGARMEAVLDMLEQASLIELGEVKPLLISEFGMTGVDSRLDAWSPERDWHKLNAYSGYTMGLMERPQIVEKSMPFMIMKALWWNHEAGNPYRTRLLREENGEWIYTELAHFYELWSRVNGERLWTQASDPDIQTAAFVDGNTIHLVVNSLDLKPVPVQINLPVDAQPQKVTLRHLHAPKGKPVFDEIDLDAVPAELEIGAQATAILELHYDQAPSPKALVQETKQYSDSYLHEIGEQPLTFKIPGKDGSSGSLRIGISREHDMALQPTVLFNGQPLDVPNDWRGIDQRTRASFFGVLEIPVPEDLMKTENEVQVEFDKPGGHLTTVTMRVFTQTPTR